MKHTHKCPICGNEEDCPVLICDEPHVVICDECWDSMDEKSRENSL